MVFVLYLNYCVHAVELWTLTGIFEVLMVVNMSLVVFWVVTLCGLVGGYHHFEGTYCLHLQG
jgi:hypothetical protein